MKNKMRHTLRILLFVPLAVSGTGCSSWFLSLTARDTFTEQQLCPKDRIQTTYIAVQPQDIFERPAPPAEIAADPGRLAVWTQKVDADFKEFDNLTLSDAVGCGIHLRYLCWYEQNGDSATDFCEKVDLDTPHARFGLYRLKPSAGEDLKQRLLAGK